MKWSKFVLHCIVLLSTISSTLSQGVHLSVCGPQYLYNSRTGKLTSPGYPQQYRESVDCNWVITAASQTSVFTVTFNDIDIEYHVTCAYDYMEIFDGEAKVGRYCGTQTPRRFTTVSSSFRVVFHSDINTIRKGFELEWKIGNESPVEKRPKKPIDNSNVNNNVGSTLSKTTSRKISERPLDITTGAGSCTLMEPANGQSVCTNGGAIGSACNHECHPGFRLEGATSSTCIAQPGRGPQWIPSFPICRGGSEIGLQSEDDEADYEWTSSEICRPITLADGASVCTNENVLGSECTISCSRGFGPTGIAKSVCALQTDGIARWSPRPAKCLDLCPAFSLGEGISTCSSGETVGSTCTHRCNFGYVLSGYSFSTCALQTDRSGQWVPETPTCQASGFALMVAGIVIGSLLLLVALGVGGYMLYKRRGKKKPRRRSTVKPKGGKGRKSIQET